MKKLIDLYAYRIVGDQVEFLIFLRSKSKIYADQWRMIGGKVHDGEAYWEAALRELKEETGLSPEQFWTVPSINNFYEAKTDQILMIPAFAAKMDVNSKPILDDEHQRYKWIQVDEVENYIHWPEQQRLMKLIHHIINGNQLLPEWQIDIS